LQAKQQGKNQRAPPGDKSVKIQINIKNLFDGLEKVEEPFEFFVYHRLFTDANGGINKFVKQLYDAKERKYPQRIWYMLVRNDNPNTPVVDNETPYKKAKDIDGNLIPYFDEETGR
jgi:hypothetical protein